LPEIFDNGSPARNRSNLISKRKQQGSAQEQPRHQMQKSVLRRSQQQQCASPTTSQAGHQQGKQQAQRRVQPFQINKSARRQSRPQSDSVRGIRFDCRHAREQQERKGDKAASAGYGIKRSGDRRAEEQEDGMGKVQTPVYQKNPKSAKRFSRRVHSPVPSRCLIGSAICVAIGASFFSRLIT